MKPGEIIGLVIFAIILIGYIVYQVGIGHHVR
jgi:hypothetical protein